MSFRENQKKLIQEIKNKERLSPEDISKISYINLHAHSTYSLLDGVGPVKEHFIQTLKKGHCGCAITDHGSYASFADLDVLRENELGDKRVAKEFEIRGVKQHDVVTGAELYIFDDRPLLKIKSILKTLITNEDRKRVCEELSEVVSRLQLIPKWGSVFNDSRKSDITIEVSTEEDNDKKSLKIGSEILQKQKNGELELLSIEEINSLFDELLIKLTKSSTHKYNHITILVKNPKGHSNLSYLTSIGTIPEKTAYGRPRITLSDLLENKEGLIVTSGCFIGMIPKAIYDESGEADELIELFLKEFKDDFYLEMHITDISMEWDRSLKKHVKLHQSNPQEKVNRGIISLAKKYNLEHKVYITQDSHLPTKEDKAIQDVHIINDKKNSNGWHFYNSYHIKDVAEMYDDFKLLFPDYSNEDFVNWCFNSMEVLEKCRGVRFDRSFKLLEPDLKNHYSVKPIVVKKEYLESLNLSLVDEVLAEEEVQKEFKTLEDSLNDPRIDKDLTLKNKERLDQSIEEIRKCFESDMDYYVQKARRFYNKGDPGTIAFINTSFFLGILDHKDEQRRRRFFKELDTLQYNGTLKLSSYFFHYESFGSIIRRWGEYAGPGRGSAAGCYVSYALGITSVDPIYYDLLMERFLQPERIGVQYHTHSKLKKEYNKRSSYESYDKLHKEVINLVEEEFRERFEQELFYIECNPGIAEYLYELKEVANGEILENESNSYIAYLMGISHRPKEGGIKRSEPSMPDIDYDSSCRDMICEYLQKKYGADHFAYICNYMSMQIKLSIKDILRIRPLSNGKLLTPVEVNELTAEVDKVKLSEEDRSEGALYCFNHIIENNKELQNFFEDNMHIKEDVEAFLGTYKSIGIHAAGAILSSVPITRSVSCRWDKDKNAFVTELDKNQVERYGFIKMDLLGLTSCKIIRDCAKRIKERHGKDYLAQGVIEETVKNLPDSVARGLENADTDGIFQANTPAPQALLRKVRNIKDPVIQFAVFTSLLRPGPMGSGMHLLFIAILNGDIPESYLHPLLETILKDTFGTLVYQEQVMKICQEIGGFSALEADSIRKAMGKKKFSQLEKYKEQFIRFSTTERGLKPEIALEMWNQMAKFAEYGFNKSHAISYSIVTNISMYFYKVYPLEWITSLLSTATREKESGDFKIYYNKWKNLIKPPSVNVSNEDYYIANDSIYMPMTTISGLRAVDSFKIAKNRPYASYHDYFVKAISNGFSGGGTTRTVIESGAMDEFTFSKSRIKKEITNGDYENLLDLNNYSEVLFGKDHLSLLREDIDSVTRLKKEGVRVDESEISRINEMINSTEIFQTPVTPINFRKFLIFKHLFEYSHYSISDKLKKSLLAVNVYTPENLFQIYSGNIFSVLNNNPDLRELLKSKPKKTKSKNKKSPDEQEDLFIQAGSAEEEKLDEGAILNLVKFGATGDAKIGQLKNEFEEILKINPKSLLLRQLKILKFTSFDFQETFKSEIDQLKSKLATPVRSLDEISEAGNKIFEVFDWHVNNIISLLRRPIKDNSPVDIIIREKYLLESYIYGNKEFGWKFKSKTERNIEKETERLGGAQEFTHFFFRSFLGMFLSGGPAVSKEYSMAINGFLTEDEVKLLSSITKKNFDTDSINTSKKISLSMDKIIDILFTYYLAREDKFCENFGKNRVFSQKGLLLRDLISQKHNIQDPTRPPIRSEAIGLINKLRISEGFLNIFKVGVDLIINGVSSEYLESALEIKTRIQANTLSEPLKKVMKDGEYVFGTIFKPEPKHFLKPVGKGKNERRVMNVSLSNNINSINLQTDYIDSIEVVNNGEKIPLSKRIGDFQPVIVKVTVGIDTWNMTPVLSYKEGSSLNFHFIEDYL